MKRPLVQKSFARRTFLQSLFFSTLLFAIVAGFYWRSQNLGTPVNIIEYALIFVFFMLYGILQWLFQKNTLAKVLAARPESAPAARKSPSPPRETDADRSKRQNHEKRLFVHLFAVLQREGRLMDFLQEDLSAYQDAQIGAAVRGIHENCRATVNRYLSPEPVMQQGEGESVEITPGFDRHAVKLVGNVVGQPPFRGILRHRGWQLRSVALPDLSETENPDIIAPAEVEVQ
jgi:Domain of unknown function (DUF2760)